MGKTRAKDFTNYLEKLKILAMRKLNKVPRILQIINIENHKIYCAFNNGEYRIIDFQKLLKKWNTQKNSFEYPLLDPRQLAKVKLIGGTLAWPQIQKQIVLSKDQKIDIHLDLDPQVLYDESVSDIEMNQKHQIGKLLREERKKAGLTQEELARRSGTTKNYISRIENNRSDIEMRTLRKIIELGLDRKLEIAVV